MMTTSRTLKSLAIVATLTAAITAAVGCKKETSETADPNPAPSPATEPAKTAPDTVGAVGTADTAAPEAKAADFSTLAGTYKLDAGHSAVMFKIGHLGISHSLGRFNKVEGDIVLGKDAPTSSVNITVAADSVYTADKKRDDHLKSPDFLNTAQFPTITFKSTSVKPLANNHFEVAGDLTLHGVTKPVVADFELVGSGKSPMDASQVLVGFTGTLSAKRSDFGMTKMIGPVGDDIDLTIAVEAARK